MKPAHSEEEKGSIDAYGHVCHTGSKRVSSKQKAHIVSAAIKQYEMYEKRAQNLRRI